MYCALENYSPELVVCEIFFFEHCNRLQTLAAYRSNSRFFLAITLADAFLCYFELAAKPIATTIFAVGCI